MKEVKTNLRQFRKMVKNQSTECLHVWLVFHKMHRGNLSEDRQRHLEKAIPNWTWQLTPGDKLVFDRITPEGQQAIREGKLPFYQDLSGEYHVTWKRSDNNALSVSVGGFYRNISGIAALKIGEE